MTTTCTARLTHQHCIRPEGHASKFHYAEGYFRRDEATGERYEVGCYFVGGENYGPARRVMPTMILTEDNDYDVLMDGYIGTAKTLLEALAMADAA